MIEQTEAPLTPEETRQQVLAEVAKRVLAKRELIPFVKRFMPNYQDGWVHHDMATRLKQFAQDIIDKKSPRLALFMPPRTGKSEMASIRFPAWLLMEHPDFEVINAGYSMDLPMKFSRKVREILRDPAYKAITQTMLDPESQSAEHWSTIQGGGYLAAGVGGGLTGKGAHCLIIDDPVKNAEEADSATTRESVWDWYWSTAYTRLSPGGGVLLIMTRWNDDDLAGRLLKASKADPEADQFEVVDYPAMAEAWEYRNTETFKIERFAEPLGATHEELFRAHRFRELEAGKPARPMKVRNMPFEILRSPGEPLHPERFTNEMLQRIKNNQPPRVWSALYQQNPVPDEGMYFRKDWFRFEPASPSSYNKAVFQAWDFAIGEKTHNDYTVGVTLIQDENDFLHVVDIVQFKGDSYTIISEILAQAKKWGSDSSCRLTVGFEDTMIWKAIKPLFLAECATQRFYPSFEELKPLTDKMARSRSLQGRMQQGRILFNELASWKNTAVNEMLRFPGGAHDDIVNALAWAVNLTMGKVPAAQKKAPQPKSWKDKLNLFGSSNGVGHMAA